MKFQTHPNLPPSPFFFFKKLVENFFLKVETTDFIDLCVLMQPYINSFWKKLTVSNSIFSLLQIIVFKFKLCFLYLRQIFGKIINQILNSLVQFEGELWVGKISKMSAVVPKNYFFEEGERKGGRWGGRGYNGSEKSKHTSHI